MPNIKIENVQVFGFEASLRAMRNPMDSWERSDSKLCIGDDIAYEYQAPEGWEIGPNDLDLLGRLTKAGTEHRKNLRFIKIWATLTLPRYVWTEFDTYKVGCERYSCSTINKLGRRHLTKDDFAEGTWQETIDKLNLLGDCFRESKDFAYIKKMKANLPEGFLQKADVSLNYETAINMFRQRKNHRLEEWRYDDEKPQLASLCNWIASLPYMTDVLEAAGVI